MFGDGGGEASVQKPFPFLIDVPQILACLIALGVLFFFFQTESRTSLAMMAFDLLYR